MGVTRPRIAGGSCTGGIRSGSVQARWVILATCLGPTGVTGSGSTGSSQKPHRREEHAAQGWGQIELPDGRVGPKEVGALVPKQVAKNTRPGRRAGRAAGAPVPACSKYTVAGVPRRDAADLRR